MTACQQFDSMSTIGCAMLWLPFRVAWVTLTAGHLTGGGKTAKVSQQGTRNELHPDFLLGSAQHLVAICYTSYTVNRSAPYMSPEKREMWFVMGTLVHSISFLISAPTVHRIPSCNMTRDVLKLIFFLVAESLFILTFEDCYIATAICFWHCARKRFYWLYKLCYVFLNALIWCLIY